MKAFLIEYEFLIAKRKRNQRVGQLLAKGKGSYERRKPLRIPIPLLAEVKKRLRLSQITVSQAMELTKLSKTEDSKI